MQPNERLNLLASELNLDGRRLAEALGVSGASISDWKSGKQPLRKTVCLALQALYGVSWRWLLEGEGAMWAFQPLGQDSQGELSYVPHLQGAASCGPGGEIMDPGAAAPRSPFDRSFLQDILKECGSGSTSDLYIVESTGESMRPTLHPGDQVLINAALPLRLKPKRGGLFLVRMDPMSADARIKRVRLSSDGRLCLTSDAPGFSPVEVELDGIPLQSLLLGRVCWASRWVMKDERPDHNW